ncbi:MAG: LuxR C-terminal-related transcriptional regulator [Coriobacteriales bacterium]|jgi:LuxR family maltose regulon positive regulatory protein|nr:LuxR C-terminal-related transcriptional regulator [Coriobacteriales bacterium]
MFTDLLSVDKPLEGDHTSFHFRRPRLTRLFREATECPLIIVCAGAGYGKTSAAHDFLNEYPAKTIWVQLSERDNVGARFWENFTHALLLENKPFANALMNLGFPDSEDKLNQYLLLLHKHERESLSRILIFDDFHLINNAAVLRFVERNVSQLPDRTSMILLSRTIPGINLASLILKGQLAMISESELRFTDAELANYFIQQGFAIKQNNLKAIINDTDGWAFAINLIARSYDKAPGYEGYLQTAMKLNIFKLMESEIWDRISERLQRFLIRLSLIDHLSVDLIRLLAKGDDGLIDELEDQNAFVRHDQNISAYHIHHLFLEFLRQKQSILSEEELEETYSLAADWCNTNGFKIDAMSFYVKIGDYQSFNDIFPALPTQIPADIAHFALDIFEGIPDEAFDRIDLLAVMHIRTVMSLGLWSEAFRLIEKYEARYLPWPNDSDFRNHTLGGIYYCWGIMRTLMCTIDNNSDFDIYFAKMNDCFSRSPVRIQRLVNHLCGPWINPVGTSQAGALQEFITTFTKAVGHVSNSLNGTMAGLDDLAMGELKFYQDDILAAEADIHRALEKARENRQYDTEHRAFFYLLRIAMLQGNYVKTEEMLSQMSLLLDQEEYSIRFATYDIALAWFYCMIGIENKVPPWLRERFTPYGHAYFLENYANQVKASYFYLTQNYPVLLAYIDELKQRESVLYGRIEMLVMEACVHYKMRNKDRAFETLREAYTAASTNRIVIPFISFGKDMRTLTAAAIKEPGIGIPHEWLEEINRKSASFAKRRSHIITEYKKANEIKDDIILTPRELEILTDLSHGLSRREIAVNRSLSVNTVKMVINIIYSKLGADNLVELIRIATEQQMIKRLEMTG